MTTTSWISKKLRTSRAPERNRTVRWTLEHAGGYQYVLTNVGDIRARRVRITAQESVDLVVDADEQDIEPAGSTPLKAAPRENTNPVITVRWAGPPQGPDRVWRQSLPKA